MVGGAGGEARIITQGGGKGTPILLPMLLPTHTCCYPHYLLTTLLCCLLFSSPTVHTCVTHTHISLNRVALQSSWHGPNEFKWSSPPLLHSLFPSLWRGFNPRLGPIGDCLMVLWWGVQACDGPAKHFQGSSRPAKTSPEDFQGSNSFESKNETELQRPAQNWPRCQYSAATMSVGQKYRFVGAKEPLLNGENGDLTFGWRTTLTLSYQQDIPLPENFPFILNGDLNCGMLFIVSGWEVGAVSKPIQETGLSTVHSAQGCKV